MKELRLATLAGILSLVAPAYAQPSCGVDARFSLPDGAAQRPVRRLGEALVFTSQLRVNADGAANTYHPLGRRLGGALDSLCNGLAVTPHSGPFANQRIFVSSDMPQDIQDRNCQMILDAFRSSRAAGYAIQPDATLHWFGIATEPTSTNYHPCIQSTGRYAGFFVSQTARPADPNAPVCSPAHWYSSTEIPYVTIPGNRLDAQGVQVGDLALVYRRHNGVEYLVAAVVGDSGNPGELGEGSIALHAALGNSASHGIPNGISGGVTTFLFPGHQATMPISATSIADRKAELIGLLGAGGEAAIPTCGQ